jgi:hypothetical protein
MKILVTEPGRYIEQSKDVPEIGCTYLLEDSVYGSNAQNSAFHALVMEYWRSGLHPKYGGSPYDEFRDRIKLTLGAGFEAYVYAVIENGKPRIYQVKKYEDIPEDVRTDPDYRGMIRGKLKSWADYNKKERQRTIDNLLDDMIATGVNSEKFQEIMEGMKGE